jgi:hypothetical protein
MKSSPTSWLFVLLVTVLAVSLDARSAHAQVPWSARTSVDTDADGTPDVFDNAPNFSNPGQEDLDSDQIGNVIDPAPTSVGPFLGDLGLTIGGPYTIPIGGPVNANYNVAVPVYGNYGHIDLDLGGDGIMDADFFGALNGTAGIINIGAGLYSDANWNLNAPGTYTLKAEAFGPGGQSQIVSTSVTVVPEPTAALLVAAAGVLLLHHRRHRWCNRNLL